MRTKFTPEYVLEMLKEIKTLCDQNKFNSIQFSKVYSSYLTFGKILESKGIFLNKTGKPTWIGIEPNLIMAKEVFRIYLENKKQIAENKKKIAENKKMNSISKEEYEIDSNKMPYIESLEKENSELKLKLQDLKENISDVIKVSKKETEIKDKKISELEFVIVELKKANGSLINQLGETQNQVFFDRDSLCSSNTYLNHRTNDLTQENVALKNKLKNAEDLLDGLKKELQIKCDLLEEKEIDSNKMPYIESLEKETEIKDKKISELEFVIVELKNANGSLINQLGTMQNKVFFDRDSLYSSNTYLNQKTKDLTQENVSLKNKLKNTEDLLDGLKNELRIKCDLLQEQEINSVCIEDLSKLNKKISEQKQKIIHLDKTLLEKDLIIQNLKSISVAERPSVSKKVKLFGIPIYSSETK